MASPYTDLDRPPLSSRFLTAALARAAEPDPLWRSVRVVTETESTQADVVRLARAGAGEGVVVVAEHQRAGRGRLDRSWVSPPRAGLTMSLLLRPQLPPAARPLLTLLVAAAAARAIEEQTALEVRVKWPNDLLVDDRKCAGLLAESVDDAIVVGIGINVSTRAAELPRPDATSLQLVAGVPVDRHRVLLAVLRAVAADYRRWVAAAGDGGAFLDEYRERSATVGRVVRVELPGDRAVEGTASDVDGAGRLVVDTADGRVALSAGDVVHLRCP